MRPMEYQRRSLYGGAVCRGPAAPFIAIAATVASTALSAAGQIQQANATSAASGYQAEVARRNMQVMEWNAQRAQQEGQAEEDKARLRTAQIKGAQRAALASQGGDVNEGSNLDILGDTERAGETDALTIRSNAALRAYGFRVQGANAGAQAGLFDMASANATANLPFSVGSTLLGGASSLADKWMAWKGKA